MSRPGAWYRDWSGESVRPGKQGKPCSGNVTLRLSPLGPDWEPDTRTLRCFVTVAEEKSITRAASRLNIAQPALSRKTANLEASLGVPLFDRSVRGVSLTPAGKLLLDRAYTIFGYLAQSYHDVTSSLDSPRGTVVGMPPNWW